MAEVRLWQVPHRLLLPTFLAGGQDGKSGEAALVFWPSSLRELLDEPHLDTLAGQLAPAAFDRPDREEDRYHDD